MTHRTVVYLLCGLTDLRPRPVSTVSAGSRRLALGKDLGFFLGREDHHRITTEDLLAKLVSTNHNKIVPTGLPSDRDSACADLRLHADFGQSTSEKEA